MINTENLTIGKWEKLTEVPTSNSAHYVVHKGIYQVAHEADLEDIGDSIVHAKIGYTGKSTNSMGRTYAIKTECGKHGCNRYLKQNNIDKESIYVRYTNCEESNISQLEIDVHRETEKLYGYRYAWKEASAGSDGQVSYIESLCENLSLDEWTELLPKLQQQADEVWYNTSRGLV